MSFETIGKNIRSFRLSKSMSQERLAELADISTIFVGMIERGEKIPSLKTFIKILNALGASADVILCDVLDNGYHIKNSVIDEKISKLSKEDRDKIYAVIDTMVSHSKRNL